MTVLQPDMVIAALEEKSTKGPERKELLQLIADEVRDAGEPYTSVYLYMLHGEELVLEAFAGRETEHQKIQVGHGVCGTAVAERRDQNVPDVRARENYIVCNRFTRSELVVLIRRGDQILGQIDVDSDVLDPFSQDEESALKSVADVLGRLL
ncbi:hypothetical protein R1flu_010341 [Riccia fluitans]|uniref:GAF domain-containing protein n=1 Tax=Riccia fluitans TaxID=41844 RepID=A0ABD1Z782_9MARC